MRISLALLVAGGALSCAHRAQSASQPGPRYGYIVLDQAAGQAFSVRPGDTLLEVRSQEVPSLVLSAVEAEAQALNFDRDCTRYFSASSGFAVLLVWKCEGDLNFHDGEVLAFFTSEGHPVAGPTQGSRPPGYDALIPGSREKKSRGGGSGSGAGSPRGP